MTKTPLRNLKIISMPSMKTIIFYLNKIHLHWFDEHFPPPHHSICSLCNRVKDDCLYIHCLFARGFDHSSFLSWTLQSASLLSLKVGFQRLLQKYPSSAKQTLYGIVWLEPFCGIFGGQDNIGFIRISHLCWIFSVAVHTIQSFCGAPTTINLLFMFINDWKDLLL